jgi:hypothetical protein
MWTDRPFRATRLSFVAITLLLIGSILSLLLDWARLGTQGQSWGLLENCPVCVAAARFIGPIAAVDTASRVAGIMVWVSFVLGLIGLAYFSQTRTTSTFETFLVAAGGFVLAFSPVVFVLLLPEAVPIHLAAGGYFALFFGVLSLVIATAGLRADAADGMITDGWAKDDDEETSRHSSEASAAATYGAVGRS